MNPFKRLPGFTRTPAGLERVVLRRLPRITLLGTLLLALPALLARMMSGPSALTQVSTVDIYVAALIILHWTVVFTVAIAAFIVMVMKGPAYVADAYPMQDAETPVTGSITGFRGRQP